MAQSTPLTSPLTYSPTTPAHLFIGPHEVALASIISWLQNIICKNNGCTVCTACRQIQLQQHHSITWLYPEKQYTLEQLKPITEHLSFALEKNEHYFFIIQKAENLTHACANALLKSLEEPPRGYHFVLLTQRPKALLPTIRSRCLQQILQDPHSSDTHPLLSYFVGHKYDATTFLQILEKDTPTEQESAELLDLLITHWCNQHKEALTTHDTDKKKLALKKIECYTQATQKLPMAGSSKLFWKNLFMLSLE